MTAQYEQDMQTLADIGKELVYVVPMEQWLYRQGDAWDVYSPVGKEGITNHLLELGYPPDLVADVIKAKRFIRVYGYEMEPGQPPLYTNHKGQLTINLWRPPTLVPKPGAYPSIQAVLDFVTKGDADGKKWLMNWMAWKIQNPGLVPKVCVVVTSEPGAGKGTLACVMSHILGPWNCDTIKREHLENRFNARWAQKLFVLGDEILSSENMKDISNSLKVYIDSNIIELEAKHQNQRSVRNRLAWMFASNDPISPVVIEKNDRRYTVFSNHDSVPHAYRQMFLGLFEADRYTPTPAFFDEIAAFADALQKTKVDVDWVSRPFENEDRRRLIDANLPGHQLFLKSVQENGIDEYLEALREDDFELNRTAKDWDFGADGITTQVLYRCYVFFCKRYGARPLRYNKFGAALKSHRPAWETKRNLTSDGKRPYCYKPPRVKPDTQPKADA